MINGDPTETAYQISWDWYQARDRSLDEVLAARLCGGHPAGQAAGPERRRAITDPESGELRFVAEPDTDPIAIIASHCATQSDFITSTMPLMEAVFRVFLAKENAPLTAEEIHDELRAWFAASPRSRYFTVETIARLLEHDRYYGITPVLAGARRAE
ncbi:MAG TPA: hypothetical protein VHL09_07165 [Dehalococcoidia bacterium]|nr:hypothetical protein [Dehalococcoidia bacterium]